MAEFLNDHDDFDIYGKHLENKRIAFIATGGIASYTAPKVIRALRRYSCEVFPYVTTEGLRFVTEDTLAWASKNKVVTRLTDKSEHLGQNNMSFDAVIVYAATYDIIGKIAGGVADDAATSLVASHLSRGNIIIIPTMHESMWNSPILQDNIGHLQQTGKVKLIGPRLENGKANVPDTATTVCNIVRALSESRLKGQKVLVTAGPTPVKIDNVRMITNKFSGKLGIEIANELFLRGADVKLLQSYTGIRPPKYINCKLHKDYDEYKYNCLDEVSDGGYNFGIFSAAVADYRPVEVVEGKIPSHGALQSIQLTETEKVIDLVLQRLKNQGEYEFKGFRQQLKMISFKYEEGKTLAQLLSIANKRLWAGHHRVIANDITLNEGDEQVCFLCAEDENRLAHVKDKATGKINIARMIADDMESVL